MEVKQNVHRLKMSISDPFKILKYTDLGFGGGGGGLKARI